MNILLLEDDEPLGGSLQQMLRASGYPTTWVRYAADAKRFLRAEEFQLLLLDIVLPDESGLEVLRWARDANIRTPVLMLTARDSITDRVNGLDGGADDYLPKPFAVPELLSRIRALLRRQGSQRKALWLIGDLEIDTMRRRVRIAGEDVPLSRREFDLLSVLAQEPGKVVSRAHLERTSSEGDETDSNTLDVHIHNLRRKLGAARIETVRGVGYVLEGDS